MRALTDVRSSDSDLVLTRPQALSRNDIATVVTEVTGRPVVHHHLTHEQQCDRLAPLVGREFVEMPAGMDRAVAEGAGDRTTDVVRRRTGRPPHDFSTVVARESAGLG
ncbi:hypothetical protein [Streptomyces canus]|uniref:hypothetical protein n=1 Tax=Streptomyces canus TaxID=58343 RepID=UPI0036E0CC01